MEHKERRENNNHVLIDIEQKLIEQLVHVSVKYLSNPTNHRLQSGDAPLPLLWQPYSERYAHPKHATPHPLPPNPFPTTMQNQRKKA